MIVTFDTSWHETRADNRQLPDAGAPIKFQGLTVEVHSGDEIDDVEIVWAPFRESRMYLDAGDLYEIQEVIGQAIAHFESKRAEQEQALAAWRQFSCGVCGEMFSKRQGVHTQQHERDEFTCYPCNINAQNEEAQA